jgi:hypothetical protein
VELARVQRSEKIEASAETTSPSVSDDGAFAAEWKMEAFKFLMSLNVLKRNKLYQGTVSRKTKLKRRSLNARQKASRKANRR